MQGFLGSAFQRGHGMFAGQGQQAMQHSRADRAALLHHRFGPTAGVLANQPGAIQQVIQTLLDNVAVRRVQMGRDGSSFTTPDL